MKRYFNIITILVNKTGSVDLNKDCNSVTVTNVGDVIATVNNQIIYPGTVGTSLGDSRTWGGHQDELYNGTIRVSFAVPTAGVQPAIEVVQKVYTLNEGIGIK